jgi:hypothetical protein
MRLITLIFLLIAPSFVAAELEWPDTKYEMGTCITPTNTTWSWFGYTGRIQDIVYSKLTNSFAYKIDISDWYLKGTYDLVV